MCVCVCTCCYAPVFCTLGGPKSASMKVYVAEYSSAMCFLELLICQNMVMI